MKIAVRRKFVIKSIFVVFFLFLFFIVTFTSHGYLLDKADYPVGIALFVQYDKGFLNLPSPPTKGEILLNSFKLNIAEYNIPAGNKGGYSSGAYNGGINLKFNGYTNASGIYGGINESDMIRGLNGKSSISEASQGIKTDFVIANESGPLPDTLGGVPDSAITPEPPGNIPANPNPAVPNTASLTRPPGYQFFEDDSENPIQSGSTETNPGNSNVPAPEPSLIISGIAGLVMMLKHKKHVGRILRI